MVDQDQVQKAKSVVQAKQLAVGAGSAAAGSAANAVVHKQLDGKVPDSARDVATKTAEGAASGAVKGGAAGAAIGAGIEGGLEAAKQIDKKQQNIADSFVGQDDETRKLGVGGTGPAHGSAARDDGEADFSESALKKAAAAGSVAAAPPAGGLVLMMLFMNWLKSFFFSMLAQVMSLVQMIGMVVAAIGKTVFGAVSKPLMAMGATAAKLLTAVTGGGVVVSATTAAAGVSIVSGVSVIALVASLFGGIFGGFAVNDTSSVKDCKAVSTVAAGPSGNGQPVDATTEKNAKDVYSILKTWGMPDANIAGILGNWTQESSIDPTSVQGFYNDKFAMTDAKKTAAANTDNGIGLGQWTFGRNTALRDYAQGQNANWWSLGVQLKFMADADSGKTVIADMLRTSKGTPEQAAVFFHDEWERSADGASGIAARGAQARLWFGKMSGWTVDQNSVKQNVGDFITGAGNAINTFFGWNKCAQTASVVSSAFADRNGKTEPGAWGGYSNGRIPISQLGPIPWAPNEHLRGDALADFIKLNEAFKGAFGYDVGVTDSYRDYDQQVKTKAESGVWAAEPGTSNHGWGMALDLGTGIASFGTPQYEWMKENAPRYGWVHPGWAEPSGRLPEPWHWEYWGVAR